MFLQPPRHSEVFNIMHSLCLCKSSGHDNIDSYFIRIACDVLTPYLTYLFHLSFEFDIFPDCLKTAKIIPIFIAGPKTDINNYQTYITAIKLFKNPRKTHLYSSFKIF